MDWRAARIAMVCLASVAGASESRAANDDPVVRLIEPERGERRFVAPATIPLEAQATAAAPRSIVRVEFFSGETLIGETTAAPHAITWLEVPEGDYSLRVRATDNTGAADWSPFISVRVRPNREPRVRLIEPVQDAQFTAPESIELSAVARDRDHNLARVEFYADGSLIGIATTEPYRLSWTPVPAGDHVLIAKAIDTLGATDESRPIRIHVTGSPRVPQLYFIHVDHLNTPRLIADDQQRTVWTWEQHEPFGASAPDENPSGLGLFEFPLRFPGQYFDKETNLHYNYFRDYDLAIGRYLQADPIGLKGGLNTYLYAVANPLAFTDLTGLAVWFCTRHMRDSNIPVANHGYFFDDKTNRCCGDPGYFAKNPLASCKEGGPKKDSCVLISSSDSDAEKLLQCCNKKTNEGRYWPFFNDCQNVGEDCIREIGMAPPNSADENRWMRCPSCWRK